MGLFAKLLKSTRPLSSAEMNTVSTVTQDAELLFEKGMELEHQGLMDAAMQSYDAAIAQMPTLAKAHFNRGVLLLDRGDALLAIESLNTALSLKPTSAGAHYNIGQAHLLLGKPDLAALSFKQALTFNPDFSDAQIALQEALELIPDLADSHFQQGLALQDHGDFAGAEASYRQAIHLKPGHVSACNNLGCLLLQAGKALEAIVFFRLPTEADPSNADAHINLADALKASGQSAAAVESYRRAVAIKPDHVSALLRLGNAQGDLSQHADAIASYDRILHIENHNCEAILNRSVSLMELGQLDKAEEGFHRVLGMEPSSAEAHSNLGLVLKKRGEFESAVERFHQAIALRADFCDAHMNLGTVLHALGRFDAALTSYKRAVELQPGYALAYSNYGTAFQSLGKLDMAEKCYVRALGINPLLSVAHNNLGILYSFSDRLEASIASYLRAIHIEPGYADAYANLGAALKDAGRLDEALTYLRRAIELDRDCVVAHHNLLFVQTYLADYPADVMFSGAKLFGEMATRAATRFTHWPNPIDVGRKLRVGFVSGDLSDHPVGCFVEGVFGALKSQFSDRLELIAYPSRTRDDFLSRRLQICCHEWHPVAGLSDKALAQKIQSDRIDILIDLSGHTAHNRLMMFAWKPAPVQATWLGYLATTGLTEMDYLIADEWTLPATGDEQFTEKIWRIPNSYLCFTPPGQIIDVAALPALANGYVTFGSFNNLSKMNDSVVALWARVLNAIPNSRLFLKSTQLSEISIRNRVIESFRAHGIDSNRLVLRTFVPREQYLTPYNEVDIALDPSPYPGITTSVESLWMGVPVLTLAGKSFLSRQGVGLLMNAGLPEWVASDPDDYVSRAVSHASNLPRLATLRAGLRQQVLASPIFDAPRFASHFEAALRGMWRKWCDQETGAPLQIEKVSDGAI